MNKLIVLAGGGSGGHITPGIAIAESLVKQGCDVMWIGAEGGLESELVPREGITYKSNGMKRVSGGLLPVVRRGFGAVVSVPAVLKMFNERKPDAVFGLGGYASVPTLVAARIKGIPYFLLELNAIPGSVTRWFASKAKCVFSNFSEARDYLSKRAFFVKTGVPLRSKIVGELAREHTRDLGKGECLLVLGGSQGARALNKAIVAAYPQLQLEFPGFRLIHITGKLDYDAAKQFYSGKPNCEVYAYTDQMADIYRCSTVALTRAGAVTLAELALAGVPSVVVPLPTAADNHQAANAEVLRAKSAVKVLNEKHLTSAKLIEELKSISHDPAEREDMTNAMKAVAKPDAADCVAKELIERISSGSKR